MNKKHLIITLFLLITFLFVQSTLAQEGRGNGRLKGYVLDSDKAPVINATVTLKYLEYNRTLKVKTNKKGKFIFITLGVGVVTIAAEKEGFIKNGIQTRVSGAKKNPKQYITLKRIDEVKAKENIENNKIKDDFKKANILFKEHKYEEALNLFLEFQKIKPKMFEIGINIGNCYLELKQYEKAIKTYKTVVDQFKGKSTDIESNKIVSQLYASIGDIFMRQNKLIKAEQYFKKSIAMDQSDPALAYNIAEIMFSAGKTNDSIKYYKMAIKIKPDWGIAYKQLGYVYLNKGNIKTAIKMLKKFLKLAPKSPDAPGVKEVIKSLK